MKSFNLGRLINQTLSTALSSQIFLAVCLFKAGQEFQKYFQDNKNGHPDQKGTPYLETLKYYWGAAVLLTLFWLL